MADLFIKNAAVRAFSTTTDDAIATAARALFDDPDALEEEKAVFVRLVTISMMLLLSTPSSTGDRTGESGRLKLDLEGARETVTVLTPKDGWVRQLVGLIEMVRLLRRLEVRVVVVAGRGGESDLTVGTVDGEITTGTYTDFSSSSSSDSDKEDNSSASSTSRSMWCILLECCLRASFFSCS